MENQAVQNMPEHRIVREKRMDAGKDGGAQRWSFLSFPPGDLDDMIFCDGDLGGHTIRHSER